MPKQRITDNSNEDTTMETKKPTTMKKPATKPATTGRQKQTGAADPKIGKQGATAAGKQIDAVSEMRGGTKQVLISEVAMTGRGGRPAGVEEYPFGDLTPAHKTDDGKIAGPSFFIPSDDRAEGRLAAARKRHKDANGKPALFWSRKRREQVNGQGSEVEGLRIWRGTPDLTEIAKR